MFYIVVLTSAQGRLNELMSQIRMQNHFGAVRSEERYNVDADLLREIKQVSRATPPAGSSGWRWRRSITDKLSSRFSST